MSNLINPFWGVSGIDLTDGLIAYWKLDDTFTGGGADAFVDSWASNDGTANSVTNGGLTAQVGDSAYTPTDGDYLNIPTSSGDFDFGGSNPFSISLWNEVTVVDTTHGCQFINRVSSGPLIRDWFFWKDESYQVEVFLWTDAGNYLHAYTADQGDVVGFYHYVMTWDGTDENGIKIYINKVEKTLTRTEVGTFTGMPETSTDIRIGSTHFHNRTRSGYHDEYKIWNKVLNQDEIDFDWANGNAGNPMF